MNILEIFGSVKLGHSIRRSSWPDGHSLRFVEEGGLINHGCEFVGVDSLIRSTAGYDELWMADVQDIEAQDWEIA